jgi:predicted membrane metal-binding protein
MKLVPLVYSLFILFVFLFGLCSFFALFMTFVVVVVFSFWCVVIVFPSVIIDDRLILVVVAKSWCRSGRRLGRRPRMRSFVENVIRWRMVVIVVRLFAGLH